MARSEKIQIDVMVNNGRTFYKHLDYEYCPLFKFEPTSVLRWLTEKLPSLSWRTDAMVFLKFPSGREYTCQLNSNKV